MLSFRFITHCPVKGVSDPFFPLLLTDLHRNDFMVDEAVNYTMTNTCHSVEFIAKLLLPLFAIKVS